MSDEPRQAPADLQVSIDEAEARWLEIWTRGPQQMVWQSMPPQLGDPAPDARLADDGGVERALSVSWAERPAAVLFWRHYGCGCGVDRGARLRQELPAFREAGVEVVVVGQADPVRTAAYKREHELDVPMLCDTELDVYGAYGLVEATVSQVLFDAPESMWTHSREAGLDFIAQRREMGRPLVDNPWMLPGEFIVDTAGTIRHAHRYQHCEDFPDPRVLLTAARLAS